MTKTKNFPHRKKARREKAREQVIRRLQTLEADLERVKKLAHGAPKSTAYAKDVARQTGYVEQVKGELRCLDANLKDNRTGKTRRKAAKRRLKLAGLAT